MDRYDCLIPAAGESSRMGGWKLLLPFEGSTVVERSVQNALGFCARVVLVVGYRGEELTRLFEANSRVLIVRHPGFAAGMFSSIRRGAEAVESDRFFIALADMPRIRPAIYRELATKEGAARPVYRGQKGHPVLLFRSIVARILASSDSSSMREVLAHVAVRELPTSDSGVVSDIDTPSDYSKALSQ